MTSALTRLALAAVLFTAAAPALAQDDPVLAKVNGAEIRQSDLAAAEAEIGQSLPPMQPDAKRDYLLTYVTDMAVLAQAAEARKIADTAEFKQKLVQLRTKLLTETLLQTEGEAAVTDAALRKVYEDAVKQMGQEQEVKASHILLETEDEAKAILAEVKKGGDFSAIAKEKSKDPSAKENSGDLGYFTKDQMVPEFADTAFKMEKGKISDPVKSQFGWHIIKVEDKRAKQAPEFDKVKDQLQNYVVRKAQADLVTKLRSEAKIERLDKKADEKKADDKPAEPAKK